MVLNRSFLKIASRVAGLLFHPLLGMLFIVLILMYGNSSFVFFSTDVKEAIVTVFALTTVAIPITIFPIMKFMGLISTYTLDNRVERSVPLLFIAICYILIYILIIDNLKIDLFSRIFISSSVLISILAVVSYFWKISIHLAILGAITAVLYMQMIEGMGAFDIWLMVSIICGGVVGSARLYLQLHNISQICGGFIMGAVLMAFLLTM